VTVLLANSHQPSPQSNLGYALRLGSEFISGIILGLIIGYVIDFYFQTNPWGMVVFIVLGTAAGFLNVFRFINQSQVNKRDGDNRNG
jgi:ATP synthase protein I